MYQACGPVHKNANVLAGISREEQCRNQIQETSGQLKLGCENSDADSDAVEESTDKRNLANVVRARALAIAVQMILQDD